MIRVNLVAERKAEKTKKPLFAFPSGNEALANLAMASVIVGAVLLCGWQYVSLRTTLSGLNTRIAEGNRERERLKDILRKAEEFKAQRELLKKKVDLITSLKKNQAVPVHLLDQMSRNLPEFLWLEQVSERSNKISLAGKATTYNAVSNLYNNLTDSPFFADVVLGTTQVANEGVSFSMTCRFVPDSLQAADDSTTTAAAVDDSGAPAAGAASLPTPGTATGPAGRVNRAAGRVNAAQGL